jgi:hypothetical protein
MPDLLSEVWANLRSMASLGNQRIIREYQVNFDLNAKRWQKRDAF